MSIERKVKRDYFKNRIKRMENTARRHNLICCNKKVMKFNKLKSSETTLCFECSVCGKETFVARKT